MSKNNHRSVQIIQKSLRFYSTLNILSRASNKSLKSVKNIIKQGLQTLAEYLPVSKQELTIHISSYSNLLNNATRATEKPPILSFFPMLSFYVEYNGMPLLLVLRSRYVGRKKAFSHSK